MSFGEEFKKMRAMGGSPKVTEEVAKEAADIAAQKDAETPPSEDPDAELVQQALKHGDSMGGQPEVEEEIVIPPPKEEAKKVKIKINGKEFDSVEEAEAYAAHALAEAEKKEAYIKGKEDALKAPEPPKPAEKKKILKIAEKLFEDPDTAFEELDAYINEAIEKRAEDRDVKKTEAQKRAEAQAKAVDDFYKANADLVDWQDEVNMVVDRNTEYLKKLPPEKIASEAARLAREYVKSVKEKALPRTTLNSKPAITPTGGSKVTTTTPKTTTENKVSFAQQVRSTNKRTVMQDDA